MDKDSLLKTITDALEELVTLEIVTAVGKVIPAKEKETSQKIKIDYGSDPKVILSRISLIQGDVTTCMDESFVTGDYKELRDYHAQKEKQGHEIIDGNLKALKALYDLVSRWGEKEGETPPEGQNEPDEPNT